MEDQEYLDLLERAHEKIPSDMVSTERWHVPTVRIELEGKNTIILNYKEIVETMKRDEKHFLKYLLQEVGTAGGQKGNKAILKGKQKPKVLDRLINNYCEKYVICETCLKPDTIILKEGRNHLLVCQACGTRHPVRL